MFSHISIPMAMLTAPRTIQMYQESFIRNNPGKFVDTAWVNVHDLKSFLSAREIHLNVYTYDLFLTCKKEKPLACVSHDPDASRAIKKERVVSPDLVVKSKPVLINIEITDPPKSTLYHSTVTEDGWEVLELLLSDDKIDIDIPERPAKYDKG